MLARPIISSGDNGKDRRFLDHGDEIIAHGEDDPRDGLRNDNVAVGLHAAQIERRCRFPHQRAGHGLDAAAIDLGCVGGILQAKGDGARQEGRKHDAEVGSTCEKNSCTRSGGVASGTQRRRRWSGERDHAAAA